MTIDLHEADALRSVVAGVAHHIDSKDWESLRALFADELETDYTSLFGGTPLRQTGDGLIANWRQLLRNVACQHLLGPVVVIGTPEGAEARCHVRAFHYAKGARSGEYWEVLGHYRFRLSRRSEAGPPGSNWQIVRMQLDAIGQTGNERLLTEAAASPTG